MKPKPPQPKRQTEREYQELQRLMASAVMRPLSAEDSMQAQWIDGQPMTKVAAGFIKRNSRLSSFERLEIYNRQYWIRLKDCFYDDYPGLRTILGERRFEKLASAYLMQHPSQSFTLRNLGRSLVDFLLANPGLTAPDSELAVDMARLEWAHIEAFDNQAKPPLKVETLAGVDPAKMRLKLQPHITVLQLGYELDRFLIEAKQETGLRDEASNALEKQRTRTHRLAKKRLKPKITYLAVHRYSDSVYYKRLQRGQYRMLRALQTNDTFEAACNELAELETRYADLGAQIRNWFTNWAALGWFCNFK